MSKTKTSSKNDYEVKNQNKEHLYNNRKVKPVKLITVEKSFFAAEYEDTNEIVTDSYNTPLSWNSLRSLN